MTQPIIAFQGAFGAYSDLACRVAYPAYRTLPCQTFQAVVQAVANGHAELGMLACENTLAGRVSEVHALLSAANFFIVGEHFQRIEHCLLALPGVKIDEISRIYTHPVAMGQIRKLIDELGAQPCFAYDTAGAAEMLVKNGKRSDAAVASALAGELNGLEILRTNVEDAEHNTTRFYVVAREKRWPTPDTQHCVTTLVFRVQNHPGALFKALRGFAKADVNMTRLESYMALGSFPSTGFLLDIEGHPDQKKIAMALDTLEGYCTEVKILGVYEASDFRFVTKQEKI